MLHYAEMELAKEVIDGLANIQNSNILSEETFLQLLDVIISYICKNISDGKSKYKFNLICLKNVKIFKIQCSHSYRYLLS